MTRHHHKTITDPGGTAWRQHAACAGMDPDVFFPTDAHGVLVAQAICLRCDVTAQCLEYALVNTLDCGVFGGKSERERRAMRRARKKATA